MELPNLNSSNLQSRSLKVDLERSIPVQLPFGGIWRICDRAMTTKVKVIPKFLHQVRVEVFEGAMSSLDESRVPK